MKLEEGILPHVAVLGAAGKMGRGISLLLLQQMASESARLESPIECLSHRLTLIDANVNGFAALKVYLKDHLKKFAEHHINELRKWYAKKQDLVENQDMVNAFVSNGMDCVSLTSSLEDAKGARLVFEAIIEDISIKVNIFNRLNHHLGNEVFYFTNTSSIPIGMLQEKSNLKGRLIGFHFYNPPAVQRLLEIIIPEHTKLQLQALAKDLAAKFNKKVVFSNDVAGFIGNGHFIREVHFACQKAKQWVQTLTLTPAIFLINRITQDYLIRPMGIFQLMDYVGVDVVHHIANIMQTFLQDQTLLDPLIEEMVQDGAMGGQTGDGLQKDGFFQYKRGVITTVYDVKQKTYISINDPIFNEANQIFSEGLPEYCPSWKSLSKDSQNEEKLKKTHSILAQGQSKGAKIAQEFLQESQRISQQLVTDGVANSIEDVHTVLKNGFFHL